MVLLVADTSALVTLGTVATHERNPLDIILDAHRVIVPDRVLAELEETASYDDQSGTAARAVLDRRTTFRVRTAALDADFPLDDGENAAVSLANDLGATQFLCDEFNRLALIHASLADTRLVTTPTLVTILVRNEFLSSNDAQALVSEMSDARSWDTNTYVAQATRTLRQASDDASDDDLV
ncbi:hypothetical protein SAMN05192561_101468 [Halopenitus malekzadehii]|uniref:PIN domain-containing protein n=1 Tax=Halopenitus malekzadehii TaxID=1267564 RepID=A0A1H6HYB8_9EURY|nr:hypothetical protein [Halopenitus malekzadehii]SEH39165.1 hypothetical protein SAMN05192561_101468 [Halopenitus malekzadehii]